MKGHRDLKYNFSSIFQIDKTDPAMTCQSYVVKGQNDLLSEPCAFPPVLLLLKSFKFVDNDKKKEP